MALLRATACHNACTIYIYLFMCSSHCCHQTYSLQFLSMDGRQPYSSDSYLSHIFLKPVCPVRSSTDEKWNKSALPQCARVAFIMMRWLFAELFLIIPFYQTEEKNYILRTSTHALHIEHMANTMCNNKIYARTAMRLMLFVWCMLLLLLLQFFCVRVHKQHNIIALDLIVCVQFLQKYVSYVCAISQTLSLKSRTIGVICVRNKYKIFVQISISCAHIISYTYIFTDTRTCQ